MNVFCVPGWLSPIFSTFKIPYMVLSVRLQKCPFPLNVCDFFSQSPPRCAALLSLFRLPEALYVSLHVVCPLSLCLSLGRRLIIQAQIILDVRDFFFQGTRVGPMAHYSSTDYCRDYARTHVKLMFHPQHNSMPNQSFLLLWLLPHPSSKRVCINSIVNYSNFRMYFFLTSVLCLVL
jgi:hypothetical protein